MRLPIRRKIPKARTSAAAMVAPTGVSRIMESKTPKTAQITPISEETTKVALKLLQTRIALIAGNTINADIRSAPASFMPITMTIAVTIAMPRL